MFQYPDGKKLLACALTLCLAELTACGGGGGGGASAPAPVVTSQFAHVINAGDNTVYTYVFDSDTGQLRYDSSVTVAVIPYFLVVDPSGRFAYVASSQSNQILVYSINATTGALTSAGAAAPTGGAPAAVRIDSTGRYLYAVNFNTSDISAYTIDGTTGQLTPIDADAGTGGVQNFPAGTNPYCLAIDASGRFLYTTNFNSNDISAYTIDGTTGQLTPIDADALMPGIQNFAAGTNPRSVAIEPAGHFAYVANLGSHDISAYTIDGTTGQLTPIDADAGTGGVQNFAAGSSPRSITVDRVGRFVYVANRISNDVSAYTIDGTTGQLTPIDADVLTPGIQNFAAGINPYYVTTDPAGRFVYVSNLNSKDISGYTIDDTTGRLTPIDADSSTAGIQNFAAGTNPQTVVIQ